MNYRINLKLAGYLRKTAIVLFICLIAFYSARGVLSISGSGIGARNIVIAIFPVALYMTCLLFFLRPDLFPWGVRSAKISYIEGFLIFIAAFLMAIFTMKYLYALTYVILFFIPLVGMLIAIYFIATREVIWGIAAFLITLPFLNFAQWEMPFLKYSYDDFISVSYICLLIIMGMVAVRILKDNARFVRTSLDKYILAFIGITFLSAIFSDNQALSLRVFGQTFIYLSVFFLITNCVHTKKDLMLLINAWIISISLQTLFHFYYGTKGIGFDLIEYIDLRTFSISEKFPVAFGIPIPIAISMAMVYSKHSIKRHLYILSGFVALMMLLFYQGRSAMFLLLLGVPMIFFYRKHKRWIIVGLIVLVFIAIISDMAPLFFKRYAQLTTIQGWEKALTMRLDGWRAALEMIRDHPFTGIGAGMWNEFIHIYGTPFRWVVDGEPIAVHITSAHNGYLHNGAEAGVIAMLIGFIICMKTILKTFSIMKRTEDDDIYTIAVGLAWICISIIINGVWISGIERGYAEIMNNWGIIALIMVLGRVVTQEQSNMSGIKQLKRQEDSNKL